MLGCDGDSNLSNKAKEFKQIFENFQKSPRIASLSQQELLLQHQIVPDFNPAMLQNFVQAKKCDCDCSEQLKQMEKKLMDKIENNNKIQNEKLDKVLTMLEKMGNKKDD